ncbi:hypothetical protein JCM10449v2_003426 [Rhodotorula kratochvilovae]
MASQELEKCLVCGKETTIRCSACQKAGIDLFFCSKEHQKLVWSTHKPFCGLEQADPFLFPPLSEEERGILLARPDYEPAIGGRSAVYVCKSMLGLERAKLPAVLDTISQRSIVQASAGSQRVLGAMRLIIFDHKRMEGGGDVDRTIAITPMLFASTTVHLSVGHYAPTPAWLTPLCRRLILHYAVRFSGSRGSPQSMTPSSTIYERSLAELRSFVTSVVARDNPEAAERFLNTVGPS